ncbi:Pumilio-family RNA binding repeat [Nakaseomyces glabratus]
MTDKTQNQEKIDDKVVAETVNSALEQLHMDDVESPEPPATGDQPTQHAPTAMQSTSPSHMFPPPQMYGFMPYSQMMHMPHPQGFFHPPEFQENMPNPSGNGRIPTVFNNSNDASMFPPLGASFPPLGVVPDGENSTGINDPFVPSNDQLWNSSNLQASAAIDVAGNTGAVPEDNGSKLTEKDAAPTAGAFRRQTFHAISTSTISDSAISDGIPTSVNDLPEKNFETAKNRTQSISFDKADSTISEGKDTKDTEKGTNATADIQNVPVNYTAAYPYGGPPFQGSPVPGVGPHQIPHSGYGVRSPFPGAFGDFGAPFQSFSPTLGGPAPPMHPHSPIPMTHSPIQIGPMPEFMKGMRPESGEGKKDENVAMIPQGFPVMQHQQNGTPPPWMYGNPAFNGMMPHSAGMNQGPQSQYPRSKDGMHDKHDKGHYNNRHRGRRNNNYYNHEDRQRKMDNSQYADATLDQFIGNIYSLCKDQHGCRFLQKQLDVLGKKASDAIFEETKEYTVELMTDSFGNYLIQKLLERVTDDQRVELAKIAAPKMVEISKDPHGTRALQKLIECISTKEEAEIVVKSLQPDTVLLSKDLNGNHVIQKCLQKLNPEDSQFIFDAAGNECGEIATHRHGCCVLQRCLDHGTKTQFKDLCEKLLKYIDMLTFDPFGNYVVQYIISKETERNDYDYTFKIVNQLKPRFTELSVHKFGSNVVEKVLRTPVVSETIINELINEGSAEVQALLNDSFGNYVLQTALDISRDTNPYMYKKLVDLVTPLLVGNIRNTPHGKRIMGILNIE